MYRLRGKQGKFSKNSGNSIFLCKELSNYSTYELFKDVASFRKVEGVTMFAKVRVVRLADGHESEVWRR